jgi:hypothetical protein
MKTIKPLIAAFLMTGIATAASSQVLILLTAASASGAVAAAPEPVTKPVDTGVYAEAGVLGLRFKDGDNTDTPKLGRFVLGYEMRKNLALEGMASFNIKRDDGVGGKTIGFYMKPKKQFGNGSEVFARLGLSDVQRDVDGRTESATRISYGVGFSTYLTREIYGQVDYMHYGNVESVKASGLTFSVGTRF